MIKGMTPEEEKDLEECLGVLNKVMEVLKETYDIPKIDNVLVRIGFNPSLEEVTWEIVPVPIPASPQVHLLVPVIEFLVTFRIKAKIYKKEIQDPGTLTISKMKDPETKEEFSFSTLISSLEDYRVVAKDDVIVFLDPGSRWSEGIGIFIGKAFLGFIGYYPRYERYGLGNLIALTAIKITSPSEYSLLRGFLRILGSVSSGRLNRK